MISLESAQAGDVEACALILEEGRRFQREQGFVQWTDDYPNIDTVRQDVQAETGYVLRVDGRLAGYLSIGFSGDPDYAEIKGSWRSDAPYAVVHRMAFSGKFRGMGLAQAAFGAVEALCRERGVQYIRVDTDFPNKRMQHILAKNGFEQFGVILFQGSEKLAYDKILP